MSAVLRIGLVAGEPSGDLLGGHLVTALRARRPGLEIRGIGGPGMIAAGMTSEHPMQMLSVRGYAEVLRHYRSIMAMRRRLVRSLLDWRPDVFVGIDAPDFNLGVEAQLKRAGIPTVHYVSPSVWAWRGWRKRRIASSADLLLALFPFEPAVYEGTGLRVAYVGHPLASMIPAVRDRAGARAALGLPEAVPCIALLPGSRRSELHYMADAFVGCAKRIHAARPEIRFVAPMASNETRSIFDAALGREAARDLPIDLIVGRSHEVLAAADVALVASGTATLEAALVGTPTVITYRMSPLTWAMMKRMLYLPWLGLPNILAGASVVPELLQEKATPEALAAALLGLLNDPGARRRQAEAFVRIRHELSKDTASGAAEAVLALAERSPYAF